MGEGPPVREAAAGLQPRWGDGGEPCAGIGGHPEGQPGSRAPRDARTRAREAGGSRVAHGEWGGPGGGEVRARCRTHRGCRRNRPSCGGERAGLGAQRGGRFIQRTDRVAAAEP